MTRASRTPYVAAIAAVAVAVGACNPFAAASRSLYATPAGTQPASPIVGIVTSVDSAGLNKVRGFTLRDSAGRQYSFAIGQLENGDQFPPGHLAEHQITAGPVEVWFRVENRQLVAYRLEDAPAANLSPSA